MVIEKVAPVRWLPKIALLGILLLCPLVGSGCNPLSYFSKNACELLNCGKLFFVEDIFPLSTRPITGGETTSTSGGETSGGEVPDDDDGHAAH